MVGVVATVYSPPSSVPLPDFDQFLRSGPNGSFDDAGYDKAWEDAIAKLAALARQNDSAGDLVGQIISFPVADGAAQYMVWKQKPLQLIHLPIGDAYQADAATTRGVRISDIRRQVQFNDAWADLGKKSDDWWQQQPVGTVVHYDNSFNSFVRGVIEVDPTDGQHKMRPTGLVGSGWGTNDLPHWTPWGEPDMGYLERRPELMRPNEGNMYEAQIANGTTKVGRDDPRPLPAIPHVLPTRTDEQIEGHRLCRIRNDAMTILQDRDGSGVHDWHRIIGDAIAKLNEARTPIDPVADLQKMAAELSGTVDSELVAAKIDLYEHGYETIARALPAAIDDPTGALRTVETVVAAIEVFQKETR